MIFLKNRAGVLPLFIFILICMISGSLQNVHALSRELNLENSITIALENNLGLQARKYELDLAQRQKEQADAAFWPNLSVFHSYTRRETEDFDFDDILDEIDQDIPNWIRDSLTDQQFSAMEDEIFSTQFDLEQPIYTGGRLTALRDQALLGIDLAELELKKETIELARRVSEAYLGILRAREAVELNKSFVKQAEEFLELTENQYEAGFVTGSDLLQARSEKSRVKRSLRQAESRLENVRRGFALLLDLPRDLRFSLETIAVHDWQPPVSRRTAHDLAGNQNPDLLLLKKQQQIASRGIDIAHSAKKPNIFLRGDYGWHDPEWGIKEGSWSLTLGLSYEIFDGGRRSAEIGEAVDRKSQLETSLEHTKNMIENAVDSIFIDLKEYEETRGYLTTQIEAAGDELEIMKLRYEAGKTTALDITQVQTQYRQARIEYQQLQYDYLNSIAQLAELMGIENMKRLF